MLLESLDQESIICREEEERSTCSFALACFENSFAIKFRRERAVELVVSYFVDLHDLIEVIGELTCNLDVCKNSCFFFCRRKTVHDDAR